MKKTLLIVRHGQAEDLPPAQDAIRHLTEKGRKDAQNVAEKVILLDEMPELLVSSTANRAIETARIFSSVFNMPQQDIQQQAEIYEARVTTLLQLICRLDDRYNNVAIFGHNPGFSDLVNHLSIEAFYDLPTAAAVQITFDAEHWNELTGQTGKITQFIAPA